MPRKNDRYKNYLFDIGLFIKEGALKAREKRSKEKKGSKAHMYEAGRVMAFYEVISLLQQEAEGFAIPLKDLQLDGIDPDKDLL